MWSGAISAPAAPRGLSRPVAMGGRWPRRRPKDSLREGNGQAGRGQLFFSCFFSHFKNISLLVTYAHYLASQGAERLMSPWEQSQSRDPAFKAHVRPRPPRRQIQRVSQKASPALSFRDAPLPTRAPASGSPRGGSQYLFPDESTNLGQAARRETGRLLRHQPQRSGRRREEARGGRQRKQSDRWPAPSRDFRTGEREAPRTAGWARCPGASARLRSTLSLHSQKSGFYAAVNRAEQWVCFGPAGSAPGLGPPPAIKSLDMAGPGVPDACSGIVEEGSWRGAPVPGGVASPAPSPATGGRVPRAGHVWSEAFCCSRCR